MLSKQEEWQGRDTSGNSEGAVSPPKSMPEQIGYRLRFAQGAVWRDLVRTFAPFDLRPQHFAALTLIASQPGCSQQDVSLRMGMKKSNFGSILDDLVVRGLVAREQKPDDRRSNALVLSREGEALMRKLNKAQEEHEGRLASLMSSEEKHVLVQLLRRLEALDDVEGDIDG